MSTRSGICIEREDGKTYGIYCHHDGYLTWNGSMLIDHYNDRATVERLMALGSISSLRERIERENPDDDRATIAYARDRGESAEQNAAKEIDLAPLMRGESEYDYVYVFGRDNRWKVWQYDHEKDGLTDLAQALEAEYRGMGLFGYEPGEYGIDKGFPEELSAIRARQEARQRDQSAEPKASETPAAVPDETKAPTPGEENTKKSAKDRFFDALAEKLLALMERGDVEWQQVWDGVSLAQQNGKTGHKYTGSNQLMLLMTGILSGYADNRWVTVPQANDLGGHVNKGAHGVMILTPWQKDLTTGKAVDKAMLEALSEEKRRQYIRENVVMCFAARTVYNVEQCSGLKLEPLMRAMKDEELAKRNEALDKLFANSPVPIREDGGAEAYYSIAHDDIHIPKQDHFHTMADYYATVLHELSHSTGAESRLNRDQSGEFGGKEYAKEELIAEFSSVFLQSAYGVEFCGRRLENHAGYLAGWKAGISEDKDFLTDVLKDAKKATDYVQTVYEKAHGVERTQEKTETDEARVLQYEPNLSFAEQVDRTLAGTLSQNDAVLVRPETPFCLRQAGFRNLPMLTTQKHIRNANRPEDAESDENQHGLSVETIKGLPRYLENPVMIMDSLTREDSVVVVTNCLDEKNRPVIIAVRPNGSGRYNSIRIESNFITSFYGREGFGQFVENALAQDKMLYWDKEKSQALYRDMRVQFPQGLYNLDSDIIIRKSKAFVNSSVQETEKNSGNSRNLDYGLPEKPAAPAQGRAVERENTIETAAKAEAAATVAEPVIPEEREEELSALFDSETNEPETQEWRNSLTPAEAALVGEWDREYARAFGETLRQIAEVETRQTAPAPEQKLTREQERLAAKANRKGWQEVDVVHGGYAETGYEYFEKISDVRLYKSEIGDVWRIGWERRGRKRTAADVFFGEADAQRAFDGVKRFVTSELASRDRFERMTAPELDAWLKEYGENAYCGESVYKVKAMRELDKRRFEQEATERAEAPKETTGEGKMRTQDKNPDIPAQSSEWHVLAIPTENIGKEYGKSTLIRMPEGEFSKFVSFVPTSLLRRKEGEPTVLRYTDKTQFTLKRDGREAVLTGKQMTDVFDGKETGIVAERVAPGKRNVERLNNIEANVPEEMKKLRQWCPYKTHWQPEKGKQGKTVLNPADGHWASSNNPETWADFETAMKYARENNCAGLAFALTSESGITCIDLDKCYNEQGIPSELAKRMQQMIPNTYTERSVSGNGLHIFVKGDVLDKNKYRNKAKTEHGELEVFSSALFISMTGNLASPNKQLGNCPSEAMLEIRKTLGKRQVSTNNYRPPAFDHSDEAVIERIRRSKKGADFETLMRGDSIIGNRNEDDFKLLNMLAFFTDCNEAQMERIFRNSGRYRDHKEGYLRHSITKAVNTLTQRPRSTFGSSPSKGRGKGPAPSR